MSNHYQNSEEERFAQRWSDEVAALGFYQKPNCFSMCLSELGLKVQEAAVLDCLFAYAFNNGGLPTSYPATQTIGKALGMGYSTVGTHLRSLECKRFIRRIYRNGTSNLYELGPAITIIRKHVLSSHPPRFQGDRRLNMSRLPSSNMKTKEESPNKNFYKKRGISSAREIMNERYKILGSKDV